MSDSETDTENSYIVVSFVEILNIFIFANINSVNCLCVDQVLSDTDENNDHSDDETDVDEVNLSVPNEEKNQNTVPETSSAESNTKCKLCNRVYSSSSNLKRHMMAEHKSTFVECSVSSCKEQIESNRMDQHLRRNHNLKKSHGENVTRRVSNTHVLKRRIYFTLNSIIFRPFHKIGVRKSTRVSTQVIKTETTVPEVAEVICENHQITCEECNHRIILPKGIQLAHGQCINPTPKVSYFCFFLQCNLIVKLYTPNLTFHIII